MWRRRLALFTAAVLFSAAACRQARPPQDFGELVSDVEARIKPEGAEVERRSQVERTKVSARVSWEIRAKSSWAAYRAWLAARLGGENGFHTKSENASQVVFSRALPADVHSLNVELLEPGPPIRVRVTFEAAAW